MTVVVLLSCAWAAKAQTDGTYSGFSPYSVFGVGQMHQPGTAWNRSMGGVGIAARSNRYVNILNPASITARDSLSFMADFGLSGRISLFTEGDKKALNTTFSIDDFVISFPLWKHTAMMLGVTPVSDVGYNISYTEMDVDTGYRTFTSSGNGGIYQIFGAFAGTLWNRLSLGAEINYRFGNINKKASTSYDESSMRDMASGDSLQVNNFTARLGVQYEHPLTHSTSLTVGATYKFSTKLNGYSIHYEERGSYDRRRISAALGEKSMKMGDELGIGISYRNADRFLVELDYTRTDWSRSRLDEVKGFSNVGDVTFSQSVGQAVRAGVAFTPNRNDIRYFMKRCTYRAGAYFDQSYYTVDGAHVNAVGITLGMTVPVFRGYNGITVGLDFGRRGLATSQVKETYFGFNLGFNVFDIWFQKRPYE
ncbi:MAG: hypothetical protein IJ714_07365 [Bacteroidales bacterium]|nr:hypothetical protein [Bacteroidales bacterium]